MVEHFCGQLPEQWWLQTQSGTWHQFGCPYLRRVNVVDDILVCCEEGLPPWQYGGAHHWSYSIRASVCAWCRERLTSGNHCGRIHRSETDRRRRQRMTQKPATQKQLDTIEKLAFELEREVTAPTTISEASKMLDKLLAVVKAKRVEAQAKAMEGVEPWKVGTVTIVGKFVMTRWQQSDLYGDTPKGVFQDTKGRKVWVTVPAGVRKEFETLDEVVDKPAAMTVTITPKDEDPYFAFGSRPSGSLV